MSSLSAFQGSAYVAAYAAIKAFLLSLSEALGQELKGSGVDVLACCAGPTRTPNYLDSKPEGVGPGALNRLSYCLLSRLLARGWAVRILAGSAGAMCAEG